ncbi:MAG: EAL domain-containing protein [Pseudomonadota bacterium]
MLHFLFIFAAIGVGILSGYSLTIGTDLAPSAIVAIASSISLSLIMLYGLARVAMRLMLTTARLDALVAQLKDHGHDLSVLEDDLDALQAKVDASTELDSDALVGEMKVLQSLLSRLETAKQQAEAAVTQGMPVQVSEDLSRGSAIPAEAGPTPVMDQTPTPMAQATEDAISGGIEADGLGPEVLGVIENALNENRLDLYLQPIVQVPSRRLRHYECFTRVRDESGEIIYPRQFIVMAEAEGLTTTVDNLLLFRCVQLVRQFGVREPGVKFFCNIAASSLGDHEFLDQFIEYMVDNRDFAERMVFEFAYDDFIALDDHVYEALDQLASVGFEFSIDKVHRLTNELVELADWNVRYLKIDADDLLAADHQMSLSEAAILLRKERIELIPTRVEDEDSLLEVLDFGVDLAQGYLFGVPRPMQDAIKPTNPPKRGKQSARSSKRIAEMRDLIEKRAASR